MGSFRREVRPRITRMKSPPSSQFPIREIRTTVRKNHAIPTRFLPQKNTKSTEIRTYGVFLFVRGMSVRGMEEGHVWIIPLTIIPLTSLRPCPSSVGQLHVHFGCGRPGRGNALVTAGRAPDKSGLPAARREHDVASSARASRRAGDCPPNPLLATSMPDALLVVFCGLPGYSMGGFMLNRISIFSPVRAKAGRSAP